jgi:dethiobiotin synthetase
MAAFFVTGSGTDIGKTFVCAGLLARWRAAGLKPSGFKPVLTGFDPTAPEGSDPALLLAALGLPADRAGIEAVAPFRFRAPLSPDQAAALEGRSLTAKEIAKACRAAIKAAQGPILIEGAGGVMTPLNGRETLLDLAAGIGIPVLFVADSRLGSLSHALTGLSVLKARGLTVAAVLVNESAAGSVGLMETADSLASHCPDMPVLGAPRGAGHDVWAQISAALGVS